MARIAQLDHIALNVRDVDRALDFYGRVLGLEALRLQAFREGKVRFVSVRITPETIIDLFPGQGPSAGQGEERLPDLNHLCLVTEAEDMEALKRRVEEEGYPVEQGPAVRWGAQGNGLSIYLRDPDGNLVEIRSYAAVPREATPAAGAVPAG